MIRRMAKSTQTQIQEQTLSQTLSPQQLLAVQLLELTTVEMEERVKGEVMDNPALEPVEQDDGTKRAARIFLKPLL